MIGAVGIEVEDAYDGSFSLGLSKSSEFNEPGLTHGPCAGLLTLKDPYSLRIFLPDHLSVFQLTMPRTTYSYIVHIGTLH